MKIVALVLTVSPSTAVPGQKVTISGTGVTQNVSDDIQNMTVKGEDVPEESSLFEVTHDGICQ